MGVIAPEEILTLRQQRRAELQELKARGEKVIGYLCNYVPVEIIFAAGAVPVRLAQADYHSAVAGKELIRVDACPFCQSTLGKLNSDPIYQLLDGIVFVNTCDLMRRLPELAATRVKVPIFQIYLPRTAEPLPARITEFTRQLQRLADFLKNITGIEVDRANLIRAITIYNQLRAKLRTLEQFRPHPGFGLKTAEFFDLIALATLLPPAATGNLIDRIINQAPPPNRDKHTPRVLLAGSIIAESDRDIINLIEEQAVIVADVVCTGARFIAEDIHPGADPLNALACYYFNRNPCACRRPNDRLFQHIQQLIIERGVQGIVYQTLLYCDPWRFEARQLRVQTQLPMLEIDHDYSRQNYEQLRTRIEAFIELLRAKNK